MNHKPKNKGSAAKATASGSRSVAANTNFGIISTGDNASFTNVEAQLTPSPKDVSTSLFGIPRPPTDIFLGRDRELEEVASILFRDGEHTKTHVVHGLGGVGKSELVLQYGHQKRESYRVVWWITADNPERIQLGLAELARRLMSGDGHSLTSEAAATWALAWLTSHHDWLLILDNVGNPSHIAGILGNLSSGGGHILITSRRDVRWPGKVTSTRLPVLQERPSVELIFRTSNCSIEDSKSSVHSIAHILGFLPLALDQAGSYIRQTRITPEKYLERLQEQPARIFSSPKGDKERETIARVWSITLETLMATEPDSVALLYVLAYFAPDDIPREIIGSAEAEVEIDEHLALLSSYSMISLTADAVSVHRLLQQVFLLSIPANDPEPQWIRDTALTWINEAVPDNPNDDIECWPFLRRLLPHINSIAELISQEEESEYLGMLLNKAGIFEHSQGNYQRALALRDRALRVAETFRGADDLSTVRSLGNLAITLQELGRYSDALPLLKRALETSVRSTPDKASIVVLLGHLARCYSGLGRHFDALPVLKRSYMYATEFYGPLHSETSIRAADLGVLYEILGWHKEAHLLFKQSFHGARRTLGESHPITAMRMARVGRSYSVLGRPEKAIQFCKEALVITRSTIANGHFLIFERMMNLAEVYRMNERPEEALVLYREALNVAAEAEFPRKGKLADILANMATAYSDAGQHKQAITSVGDAIAYALQEESQDAQQVANLRILRKAILKRSSP